MTNRSSFITDPAELGSILHLPEQVIAEGVENCRDVPFRVPRELVPKIEQGNQNDPILLQFWPSAEERKSCSGFTVDPLREWSNETGLEKRPLPASLLQKYAGRVLVVSDGPCAAKCRFCFRRHFPKSAPPSWEEISQFLENTPSIEELILSGGDPLGKSDGEIESSIYYIKGLSFVKRVRIHTRYPVIVPERISERLLLLFQLLIQAGKKVIIVFHINHPAELDSETFRMSEKLTSLGISLLAQTVLLRKINDSPQILASLFLKEFDAGILPYYLHQLDHVAGAAHFEVSTKRGLAIFSELRRILPGYLLPRYVQEIPGEPSKLPVQHNSLDC